MEKVRYETDPHNRLVSKKTGRDTELPFFRQVLDGEFRTDKKNNLAYHVKAPVPFRLKAPHQIKLKGKWSLDKDHDLVFTLDKSKRQEPADRLTIRGDIIDAGKNSLLFAVTTVRREDNRSTYILKLEGAWQADKYNRITFKVNKEKGRTDILTFNGIWEIGPGYQIVYKYEKELLVRKKKRFHTIAFKGAWEIKDKARISYAIDRRSDSVMDFKASAGIFRDNYIKYELGIGGSRRVRPVRRAIVLFGDWKIRRGSGLVFEVRRGREGLQYISFGAEARVTDKDTVLFRLKDGSGRKLGIELELTRRIFGKEGESYIRLLRSGRERAVFAGAGFRW